MIAPVTGPDVWRGDELQDDTSWILHFDDTMLTEIDELIGRATSLDLTIPFDAEQLPFDVCAPLFAQARSLIDDGPGFALLRGIPRHRYTQEQCEILYWALGVHYGTPVSQNSKGHIMGHVRDLGLSMTNPDVRSYQTNSKLDYHADQLPVDVLGLFCLETAMQGGESKIVSAMEVHNVVQGERPDLLEVLYGHFNIDWRGEQPDGEQPWYTQPMYSEAGGKVSTRFTTLAYFHSVVRYGDELAPSDEQIEALEFVQDIANRPGMALSMDFQPGDIQLLNNMSMLHARESYIDHPDPERQRHLLRMWVAYPQGEGRQLSPLLDHRYRYVLMGGIPAKKSSST
ncbi:MAG: TauD/TfdA family dioxygenase [Acidimicrobiales bacterium]